MPTTFTVEEDYQDSRFDKWFKNNVLDIPHSLIEKFIRLQKNNEYKQLTNWDYTMSIVYIGLSFLMLSVIILLFIDIIRDKLI